tara:strand:+ start:2564 stop:2848 length:285 start_codon:yes stop_codon:yes gene_type:complete
MNNNAEPFLRLREFKDLAKWLKKKLPYPLAYFCIAYLWRLEAFYIEHKIVTAVDKAIEPHLPSQDFTTPHRFSSRPSEVKGLDIIEIQADYEKD